MTVYHPGPRQLKMWWILNLYNNYKNNWTNSTLARATKVLSRNDQRKMILVTGVQILLSILDLLGVAIIGVLGALAVSGIQSHQPGTRVASVLNFLHIGGRNFQTQATILGLLAVFFLVGRTVLSIFFTRRILFFLSRRGAKISADLISRLLSQSMLTIQAKTIQETVFSVTVGVEVITLEVLAVAVSLITDLALLCVILLGLFIVDPTIAIGSLAVFGCIAFFLYLFMHVRAHSLGLRNSSLRVQSNEKITEAFSSYRESIVRNRRDFYSREIGKLRFALADVMAETKFMPYIGKYVIETTVILGAVLLGATQFLLQDATHAVATLSVFLAAGTRIAPAVLRMQQGAVSIRGSLAAANVTLDLIDSLQGVQHTENLDDSVDTIHENFIATLEVADVHFTYPGRQEKALSDISLKVPVGASVAIVGPSGAGKTSLVDVILGVIDPDKGMVLISGKQPLHAVAQWPGAISYVAQDVLIVNGTIRENVGLGYPTAAATDELVMEALTVARLDEFVKNLPNGIDTAVGERGAQISGGQRQRLGIARAMFTKPHLLVLDEATSSLDGETEASITDAIHELRGSTTVLMIAHRLSTVRNADLVVYLARGEAIAVGSFEHVRNSVPDFDRQAKLMGL